MPASSIRARVRAEMIDEIKNIARQHLASEGANLSLRAVARDLGVVSSGIYRYFASRDDLLTALILDAYNAVGAAVEAADAAVDPDDLTARWMAVCHAFRDWALAVPHEYALIYGSPVPGYQAPEDTVPAGIRTITVLGRILQHGAQRGAFANADADPPLPPPVADTVALISAAVCPDVPPSVLARGLNGWTLLVGAVCFELFGQLTLVADRRAFFDHQMRTQAAYVGV